jgi:molybdenum cofactor guanylyltransferase
MNAIHDSITAVILAGGRSSRMQTDKAQLVWQGRTFVEHLIEQLQPQTNSVAINSNEAKVHQKWGLPLLKDPFPDRRGPLAGILAGLTFSNTPLTLFVPCDNPLLAPDLAIHLYNVMQRNEADIVYAQSGSDNHYLYALMKTRLQSHLEEYLRHGNYAVHRWYATQRCQAATFDADHFINMNSPNDLEHLSTLRPK